VVLTSTISSISLFCLVPVGGLVPGMTEWMDGWMDCARGYGYEITPSLEIPFETETQLRERGSSRTPDVLLTCPIGVRLPTTGEWKVVCWIDSKVCLGLFEFAIPAFQEYDFNCV
jgi:hypothetical protein